jgi:hypothetical protein
MTDLTPNNSNPTPTPKAKKPFYKRSWFIVLASLLVIGGIANATNNDSEVASAPAVTVTVTAEPTPTETPTAEVAEVEPSPTPEETVNVDSDFNIASFRSSAKGNIADLKKWSAKLPHAI